MPTEMICPRHYTLRTRDGHVIHFEPNKPKMVPDAVVAEAMAFNIIPTTGFRDEAPEMSAGKPIKINIPPQLREALIYKVMSDLVEENNPDHFDGGGAPKLSILVDRTGLTLLNKEKNDYWGKHRELRSTNSEIPTHKLVDVVLDIQYLSTPKDTKEYAQAMGVPEQDVIGRPVSQQKKILLAYALKQAT